MNIKDLCNFNYYVYIFKIIYMNEPNGKPYSNLIEKFVL